MTDRYERMMLDKTNEHREEMKNFIEGQKYWVKPSLWARITGRYKDMYLVFNHLRPHHCTHCGTNQVGVNFGIEAMTLDLETALTYIDELFEKYTGAKSPSFAHPSRQKVSKKRTDRERLHFPHKRLGCRQAKIHHR